MTAYEIISTFIGISALLISFGGLLIAVLTFLDKKIRENKNAYPVSSRVGGVCKDTH